MVLFAQGLKVHPGYGIVLDIAPAGGLYAPVGYGQGQIGHYYGRIHPHLDAKAGAGGAGAVWVIEGEGPGGQLLYGYAAVLAGVVLREHHVPLLLGQIHYDDSP